MNGAAINTWIAWAMGISRGGALATAVPMVAYGQMWFPLAHVLSTAVSANIPTGATAPVNIDATAALGFMIQAANSGANGNTYAVHDITFEALN